MIFNSFYHDRVLKFRGRHLHSSRATDGWVGDITVSGNFVRCIYHYHALFEFLAKHASDLAKLCGLPNSRPSEQENASTGFHYITNYVNSAIDRSSDTASKPDYLSLAISDGGNAMKGSLDACAVISAEIADSVDDVIDIIGTHFKIVDFKNAGGKSGFGNSAQV